MSLTTEDKVDRLYEAFHKLIDETPIEAIGHSLRDDLYTILEEMDDGNIRSDTD